MARAVEHQQVHRDAGEAEAQAVEHGDQADRLALDARLLVHLLHHDLRRRVADVGPARRVEPHARVGPLHEQDLAVVVADDGGDGDLRRDVAGDALADLAQPLVDDVAGVEVEPGGHADVGGDREHLLEALLLVEALGEAEPGAGDAGQRLAPAQQVGLRDRVVRRRALLVVPCRHGRRPYRPYPRPLRAACRTARSISASRSLVGDLPAGGVADVERVDDLRADRGHERLADVEVELGEGPGDAVEQADRVGGLHVDDRGRLRRAVVERRPRSAPASPPRPAARRRSGPGRRGGR